MISSANLTVGRVRTILANAGIECTVDDDGDLIARINSLKVLVKPMPEKELLKFATVLGAKSLVSRGKLVEAANAFNDQMVMVRMCVPEQNSKVVWADYDIVIKEGLSEEQLVAAARRFGEVVMQGAVLHMSNVLS